MSSLFEKKYWVFLFALLALGALAVLSVSLKNVSFHEAQPIGREEAQALILESETTTEPLQEVSLRSQVIFWVAITLLVFLVGLLLSPETRKKLIRIAIRVAVTYWGLYFLLKKYPDALAALNLNLWGSSTVQQANDASNVPPPVFTPPRETPLLSYFISLLIVLGALWLLWTMYRTWQKTSRSSSGRLQEFARIAHTSLHELSNGHETTDVIMNCYFRMSAVVADTRHIQRGMSMTPAEFARRLESSGLPMDAVQRLTSLFERARYGERKVGPKETNEAVACLTAILQSCGEAQ